MVSGLFGVGFSIFTGCLTRQLAQRSRPRRRRLPPVTIYRPIKRGAIHVEANIRELIGACHPNDQIIIGVGSESECIQLASQIHGPQRVRVDFVVCKPQQHLNPKVSKLVQMEVFAQHERLIITDAETLVSAEFLDAFRSEWEASGASAISAPYRIQPEGAVWDRLDHAASFMTFWPGCFMLQERGEVDFLLGACMGVQNEALSAIGGWRALGDFLAEDHQLGKCLVASGRRVVISRAVVMMNGDGMGFRSWIFHQHRVARTHRLVAPRGYMGLPLMFGTSAMLWWWICRPSSCIALIAASLGLVRVWGIGGSVRVLEGGEAPVRVPIWAILLATLFEPIFWLAGLLPLPVRWAGRRMFCKEGGKIWKSKST